MRQRNSSSIIFQKLCSEVFEAASFTKLAEELFLTVDASESRIRSGVHIPQALKSHISSYRIIGKHIPASGSGRIDIIQIKLAPGVLASDSFAQARCFIDDYMTKNKASGLLAAAVSAPDEPSLLMLAEPDSAQRIEPEEGLLDFLCVEGIKNYLQKSCDLAREALDGYFANERILYDDSVIASHAQSIDAALSRIRFCDIAASGGAVVLHMIAQIAGVRFGLRKYMTGRTAERRLENLIKDFIENSLYLTDCSAASLDMIFAALRLIYPYAAPDREKFVWGSVLVENIFNDLKFDLIVTLPPHLRAERFAALKELLSGYSSQRFKADLYCYYIERAAGMLASDGSAVTLSSDRWMKAAYGEGLKDFFRVTPPRLIASLGNRLSSKGSALQLTAISLFSEPCAEATIYMDAAACSQDSSLSDYICDNAPQPQQNGAVVSISEPNSKTRSEILAAIKEKSLSLFQYAQGEIYRGVLTGLNAAFVIDNETASRIKNTEQNSAELIVPFYSGRDVKPYSLPPVKKQLIFIEKGYTNRHRELDDALFWFATKHPLVAAHLAQFEKEALARRDRGDFWWELRPCKYKAIFQKPKILMPVISKKITAAMDTAGVYFNDKCTAVCVADYFILALLNSTLMDFVYRAGAPELLNGYYELRPSQIANLPVCRISAGETKKLELKEKIERAAQALSALYANEPPQKHGRRSDAAITLEKEIDRDIFQLYGLTPTQRSVIENN